MMSNLSELKLQNSYKKRGSKSSLPWLRQWFLRIPKTQDKLDFKIKTLLCQRTLHKEREMTALWNERKYLKSIYVKDFVSNIRDSNIKTFFKWTSDLKRYISPKMLYKGPINT